MDNGYQKFVATEKSFPVSKWESELNKYMVSPCFLWETWTGLCGVLTSIPGELEQQALSLTRPHWCYCGWMGEEVTQAGNQSLTESLPSAVETVMVLSKLWSAVHTKLGYKTQSWIILCIQRHVIGIHNFCASWILKYAKHTVRGICCKSYIIELQRLIEHDGFQYSTPACTDSLEKPSAGGVYCTSKNKDILGLTLAPFSPFAPGNPGKPLEPCKTRRETW